MQNPLESHMPVKIFVPEIVQCASFVQLLHAWYALLQPLPPWLLQCESAEHT